MSVKIKKQKELKKQVIEESPPTSTTAEIIKIINKQKRVKKAPEPIAIYATESDTSIPENYVKEEEVFFKEIVVEIKEKRGRGRPKKIIV